MIPPPYPGSYSAGPGGAGANPTPNSGLPPYPVNPSYNPYNPAPGTAANPGGGGPVQQPQHNSSVGFVYRVYQVQNNRYQNLRFKIANFLERFSNFEPYTSTSR